jgi:hypothetical protein
MTKNLLAWLRQALILLALLNAFGPAAAQRISQLPAAASVYGTEMIPCVQSGATKECTINQIVSPTSFAARAQKILRAAARGITPITQVLATPATYSQGAANAASTVNAAATTPFITTGSVLVSDPRITPIGGPWAVIATPQQRIQGPFTSTQRQHGHGAGMRFEFYGQVFDFSANFYGLGFTCYDTDPTTGVRARCAANDYLDTPGFTFHKIDLQVTRLHLVEVYGASASTTFGAINLPANGTALYAYRTPDQPLIAILGDSWTAGVLSGGTNSVKLAVTDYFAAGIGVASPLSFGIGGTDFIWDAGITNGTFRQRILQGDINNTRIGDMDAVILPASVNAPIQFVGGNTAVSPAALRAEIPLALGAARTAQPHAILVVTGQEYTTATPVTQDFYDATKGGVADYVAATGDKGVLYLDNSATGENWLFGTTTTGINSVAFTGSQNHVNDVGKVIYGERWAHSFISALRTMVEPTVINAVELRDLPRLPMPAQANDNHLAPERLAA